MTATTGKIDTSKITVGDIKAENLLKNLARELEIKEKEKSLKIPILPKEIAEMLEKAKKDDMSLLDTMVYCQPDLVKFFNKKGQEAFARAWLDGFETPSGIQLPEGETELEYYERILKMLPLYPTPLLNHAMAYVSTKIDRLKEAEKRKNELDIVLEVE